MLESFYLGRHTVMIFSCKISISTLETFYLSLLKSLNFTPEYFTWICVAKLENKQDVPPTSSIMFFAIEHRCKDDDSLLTLD